MYIAKPRICTNSAPSPSSYPLKLLPHVLFHTVDSGGTFRSRSWPEVSTTLSPCESEQAFIEQRPHLMESIVQYATSTCRPNFCKDVPPRGVIMLCWITKSHARCARTPSHSRTTIDWSCDGAGLTFLQPIETYEALSSPRSGAPEPGLCRQLAHVRAPRCGPFWLWLSDQ
jgi:hypothetical protein